MGVFAELVAPSLGAILANIMFASPLSAVLHVRRTQQLGDLNPLPFPVITANCVGWLIYSVTTQNPFLFGGNILGTLLGIYYTLTTIVYATPKVRDLMIAIFVAFPLLYYSQLFGYAMADASNDMVRFSIGLSTNIVLVVYYAAPLSVFYKVITTRNSSSLYFPLVVTNTANGAMWFTYGLIALTDPMVWAPNVIGVLLGVFSILLIIIYPRKEQSDSLCTSSAFSRGPSLKPKNVNVNGNMQMVDSSMSIDRMNGDLDVKDASSEEKV
eukprot:TRINITY_DN4892_c0_g1_i1.p2 TRINITY_DN4892_c0_g1~~TRINITY_DN4892_c0_g1_i1.p2  ORF type:complete len:269 (-),score=19.12 TRINITY_DN4892_c0_g1_i1:3633-4439(-)